MLALRGAAQLPARQRVRAVQQVRPGGPVSSEQGHLRPVRGVAAVPERPPCRQVLQVRRMLQSARAAVVPSLQGLVPHADRLPQHRVQGVREEDKVRSPATRAPR